ETAGTAACEVSMDAQQWMEAWWYRGGKTIVRPLTQADRSGRSCRRCRCGTATRSTPHSWRQSGSTTMTTDDFDELILSDIQKLQQGFELCRGKCLNSSSGDFCYGLVLSNQELAIVVYPDGKLTIWATVVLKDETFFVADKPLLSLDLADPNYHRKL